MATLQETYVEDIGYGRVGMVANATPCVIDSWEIEGGNIGFGICVQRSTSNDEGVIIGVSGTHTGGPTSFLGVAVQDHTRPGGTPVNSYTTGNIAAVLSSGDVWVSPDAAVTAGSDVTVNGTTGRLSTKDAAAAGANPVQIPIANARWMTDGTENGLAVVRLGGHIV